MKREIHKRLNQTRLNAGDEPTAGSARISRFTYNRNKVTPGVVHFGVGNFHRCHQAMYFEALLNKGALDWGIVGVSLRSATARDRLAPQDYLYTQVTLSEQSRLHIVGALLHILVAPEDPMAVVEQVANPAIKLVTTTITEKGYYLSAGDQNVKHPDFLADLESLLCPKTIYGYLAAAIIRRHSRSLETNTTPLNIVCCDNIQAGGERLRTGVTTMLERHSPGSAQWARSHIRFASSMVDRVSPTTTIELTEKVSSDLGLQDDWPVSAEPFSQWVIEDRFDGEQPALASVGVQFSADVTQYEQMKLRFLNAAHSAIAVLGYLDNRPTVHEALEQTDIDGFVSDFLLETLVPVTTIPSGERATDYIASVLQRFRNSALPYQVLQICTDSSQKIQQRWYPSIEDTLTQGGNTDRFSLMLAAWVVYVQQALPRNDLDDPSADQFRAVQHSPNPVTEFLQIAGASQTNFYQNRTFIGEIERYYAKLKKYPLDTVLRELKTHCKGRLGAQETTHQQTGENRHA